MSFLDPFLGARGYDAEVRAPFSPDRACMHALRAEASSFFIYPLATTVICYSARLLAVTGTQYLVI
jgi:hypothetical protein